MSSNHKFSYQWSISKGYPSEGIEHHGLKVFGTFICGGGSTMGYKLSGYEHLGGVEIDERMSKIYRANHNPKYLFTEDIRDFLNRKDIPEELFNLDILDGSPPCSTFSTSGNREKDWGKEKVFREGQKKQRLDDLFFTYIDLAQRLQSKVVLAENVSGLIKGNAKAYTAEIIKSFGLAGYNVQLFHLNSATMGIPQARERVFFICHRKDLNLPKLKLSFSEPIIPFRDIMDNSCKSRDIIPSLKKLIPFIKYGDCDFSDADYRRRGKRSFFNHAIVYNKKPLLTVDTHSLLYSYENKRMINDNELAVGCTFPTDYNYMNENIPYVVGMSVPPVMMAQVAHQIFLQWFKNGKE